MNGDKLIWLYEMEDKCIFIRLASDCINVRKVKISYLRVTKKVNELLFPTYRFYLTLIVFIHLILVFLLIPNSVLINTHIALYFLCP